MKNNSLASVSDRYMSYVWYDDRQEVLLLPVLLYVWGLVKQDSLFLGFAALLWMAGYAIWCLWTLWKVSERFPAEDNWRAIAVLVYGGTSWVLILALAIVFRG
ncbi:MAG TPA: hypothetical protein VFE18_19885, partial [Phenylobacterium sp.]|uniref:hypothetical protein n=1 Tax=Phenylobacterium sp. TaxID=1871053 RepID=UPI002D296BF0